MNMALKKHTVGSYDKELKNITKSLKEMGKLVNEILSVIELQIGGKKSGAYAQAEEIDQKINKRDSKIEKNATEIIALRSPMAVDLRFVMSSIKIATILERAGDIAKSSVKHIEKDAVEIPDNIKSDLSKIVTLVTKMINNSVKGFGKFDTEKADKVWDKEDKVDELTERVFGQIKTHMRDNPSSISSGASLLIVAKNLERLGDYATNVTKIAHYVSSGKRWKANDNIEDTIA